MTKCVLHVIVIETFSVVRGHIHGKRSPPTSLGDAPTSFSSSHSSYLTSLRPQYSRARLVKEVGRRGSVDGEFRGPWGIVCMPSGMVVVTDCGNHRLQMFTEDLDHVRSVGSEGTVAGQFMYPTGVTTDGHGRIFIADYGNHRIQVVDQQGSHLYTFGYEGNWCSQCKCPHGITMDQHQRLLVCDSENKRVQVVAADGRHMSTLTQTGPGLGQLRTAPWFISSDSNNHVTVTDMDSNLYMFNDKGDHIRTMLCGQPGGLSKAGGTVTDPWGTLLVADLKAGCVCVLREEGRVSCRIGRKENGPGHIGEPVGMALTKGGDLLVCDYGANKLLKFEIPKSTN